MWLRARGCVKYSRPSGASSLAVAEEDDIIPNPFTVNKRRTRAQAGHESLTTTSDQVYKDAYCIAYAPVATLVKKGLGLM
jgi:hypothetical protein